MTVRRTACWAAHPTLSFLKTNCSYNPTFRPKCWRGCARRVFPPSNTRGQSERRACCRWCCAGLPRSPWPVGSLSRCPKAWPDRHHQGLVLQSSASASSRRGCGETGRRSRLQLECPRGNARSRTAQSRGTPSWPIPSQARSREGVETGRAAPTAAIAATVKGQSRPRTIWPDRPSGGASRSGKKICFPEGSAGSIPAIRTICLVP